MYRKKRFVYIAKLNDSYVFNGNPFMSHFYIVEKENKTNDVKLRQLTHLYRPDAKRIGQLRSGLLSKIKLENFDCASGVKKYTFNHDSNGNNLTPKSIAKNSKDGIHKVKLIK